MRVKETGEPLTGNDRFEGFCKDLIDALSVKLKFKYEFFITEGDTYGRHDEATDRWSGLIGDILDRVSLLMILFPDRRTCTIILES